MVGHVRPVLSFAVTKKKVPRSAWMTRITSPLTCNRSLTSFSTVSPREHGCPGRATSTYPGRCGRRRTTAARPGTLCALATAFTRSVNNHEAPFWNGDRRPTVDRSRQQHRAGASVIGASTAKHQRARRMGVSVPNSGARRFSRRVRLWRRLDASAHDSARGHPRHAGPEVWIVPMGGWGRAHTALGIPTTDTAPWWSVHEAPRTAGRPRVEPSCTAAGATNSQPTRS
jgi:hypothetical protein